jgi:hypothetical protein
MHIRVSHILASRWHRRLFLVVACFNPIVWGLAVALLLAICAVNSLDGAYGLHQELMVWLLVLVGMAPFALWLIWGCYYVPYRPVLGVVCAIHSKRTLAVHMDKRMPSGRTFFRAARASVMLAQEINFRRLELRSPIFGSAQRELAWVEWVERTVRSVAPNALVRIIDREPLNWYMTKRYLHSYGIQPSSAFTASGRLRAARIFIENI